MSVFRVKAEPGKEPCDWKVEKYSDIDYEEWVKRFNELPDLLGAGNIEGEQRAQVKEAMTAILIEGLMPAYLELKAIRKLKDSNLPIMDHRQPYEDLARKVWKAYKVYTQRAVELMGFDIGFLFQKETTFESGLIEFRKKHSNMRPTFEDLLKWARRVWQEPLANFRNTLEHEGRDHPEEFPAFYTPEHSERLFKFAWVTITDLLPMLLESKLPHGMRLVQQNGPGPRFTYHIPGFPNNITE